MTAAVTPKGERRRSALVDAAADLLAEGGFDAVRHRAVAQRAGLPLASTTYYFSSLDDLIAKAVECVGERENDRLRAGVELLPRRRRAAEATADVLVDLVLGDGVDVAVIDQLVARYERCVACVRQPRLREVQRRLMRGRTAALVDAVGRCGRVVRRERLVALVCAVEGAVLAALLVEGGDPRATARATMIDVIDVLAPLA